MSLTLTESDDIILFNVLETPHVIVGAAIATKVVNPALSLPLALGSHFILEKIPHWNPHLNTEIKKFGRPTKKSTVITIVDASLALVIGSYLSYRTLPDINHAATIFLACFLSALPDIVEGPYFFLGLRHKIIKKWIAFQKSIQKDSPVIPGLLTQIITVLAAFWWIFG